MKTLTLGHVLVLCASVASVAGCKDDPKPTPPASSATAAVTTPVPTASAAPKAAASNAKPDKNHKKSLPTAAQPHPVPTDWIELTDDVRGFSFSVPKDTTGHAQDK